MAGAGRTVGGRALAVLPLVVLVGVVVALVAVRVARGPVGQPAGGPGTPSSPSGQVSLPADPTSVLAAASAVPPAALDAVGAGDVVRVPIAVNGRLVETGGLPRVVWVASEDCAPCAATAWSMLVALSRFGTFQGLDLVASAADGDYPGTIGPSFRDATFTSDLLAPTFYESPVQGGPGPRPVAAADAALIARYDAPPYVSDTKPRPFVLFAGQYVSAGAAFTPAVLDGLDAATTAAALSDPASAAGRAVDGAANVFTAVLCVATGGAPAAVCTSPGVTAATATIGRRTG